MDFDCINSFCSDPLKSVLKNFWKNWPTIHLKAFRKLTFSSKVICKGLDYDELSYPDASLNREGSHKSAQIKEYMGSTDLDIQNNAFTNSLSIEVKIAFRSRRFYLYQF